MPDCRGQHREHHGLVTQCSVSQKRFLLLFIFNWVFARHISLLHVHDQVQNCLDVAFDRFQLTWDDEGMINSKHFACDEAATGRHILGQPTETGVLCR